MTTMTPESCERIGIMDPDYLRRMGEPESSVEYLTRPQSSLLAVFGDALRPTIEPMNRPRVDTGD